MFDIFKQDINIGDKVKLYLTTGKEPEGIVISIGDNFVLLQADDNTQNRFFDKLIGGWDVLQTNKSINERKDFIRSTSSQIINKVLLLEKVDNLKAFVKSNDYSISPNANITKAKGTTCIASNNEFTKILILNNKIVDPELIKEIEEFQSGGIIPVAIQYYKKDEKNVMATVVAKPQAITSFVDLLKTLIIEEDYGKANLLTYLLKAAIKGYNKDFGFIIKELKKVAGTFKTQPLTRINIQHPEDKEDKKVFKNVEKEINELIRQSKFEYALSQIEKELKSDKIEDKYKSSLLLKKAQIYSSIGNPDDSEKAYQELVIFNEKIGSPNNNLSHLYTELARLQSLKIEKQAHALLSIKKALSYNPINNYALNLLRQFEGKDAKRTIESHDSLNSEEHLIIDSEDDSTSISRMIDLDIKEHKYTHPEIIRLGGKPTAYISKLILIEAKKTKEGDLSERYPIYLEAAKAFSELNVGSYDLQDYLEAIAFYAMLKGNSLFINFRNKIFNNEVDIIKLKRLSDSACSYYLESLNLLSNIEPKLLLVILSNYLKLNICLYHIENKTSIDINTVFKGQFSDIFSSCLENQNENIEKIAYLTILSVGASSINAWNKLTLIPKGTRRLYGEFGNEKRKFRIYKLINDLEKTNISEKLSPSEFLKKTFNQRKQNKESLSEILSKILNIDFEPYGIQEFITKFKELEDFERFFTSTDIEIKNEVINILSIFKPYLNRNQAERTNLLIQTRSIIEKQIIFINENTTFYGRSYFYGLISKWKKEIDKLLEEKISQSYPILEPIIDPPYYIQTEGAISLPLLIRNKGEATSEGFYMHILYESTVYEESLENEFKSNTEIASEGRVQLDIEIPKDLLEDSKAIELKLEISPIYQKKKLPSSKFEFTVEEEPDSTLTYEDIPWRDGPVPPEHLFKGRKKLIANLAQHYLSVEKDKPYILYGLTRTGKSSILEYLRKDLEGETFITQGKEKLVLTFKWELNVADSYNKASDFWNYTLFQQTFVELEKYSKVYDFSLNGLKIAENSVRAKDFKIILDVLESKNLYPIFFVDEFSFIKSLIDKQTVNAAFLHTLRQYSLDGLASFIFAGTYDIKALIKDPKYGITGQLVHAIDEQINEISDEAAQQLIEVINDKLSFTPEAISHIMFLSGNVPYFIQIICKNCGYYACENKRRYIGYPELEKVVQILIGQEPSYSNSLVKKLPENTFQNNQYSPADPKEVSVLISSLAHFNKDKINDPRGISFAELQKLWADKKINAFRQKLAETIQLLKDKKILIQEEDEGMPVYKLSVDLFRRWWAIQYPDINLILTTLID